MPYTKVIKDAFIRFLNPKGVVPQGLVELVRYFKSYGAIKFNHSMGEDGSLIAESENFRYGSIITSGRTPDELDQNIRDAILTAFDVPSSYEREAGIRREGETKMEYAIA